MNIVINLFGPSAAGKSTTAHLLQHCTDNMQTVDFDMIKRQIPNYDWLLHAQAGRDMTLNRLDTLLQSKENLILLLMPSPRDKQEYAQTQSIIEAHEYTLINVEITAPREVLIERYEHRLANIDPEKKNWKFKTLEEFTAKLKEPYYRPPDTHVFDSSKNDPSEIANNIEAFLSS